MNLTSPLAVRPLDRGKVQAILFDVDGTLSNSDDQMAIKVQRWLKPLEFLIRAATARRFAHWLIMTSETPGNSILELADRLSLDHHLARFLDRRASQKGHAALTPENFPPIPGAVETLSVLQSHFKMAVVSARNELTTRLFLQANRLEEYFQVVVTSQTCLRTKPFPDPLWYAAGALQVPIENCLMVGDTATDVRAAIAAGAQPLSV
ncbi:MAG: HAD family hydrolase, partial [Anaerolineaceae bacterium]